MQPALRKAVLHRRQTAHIEMPHPETRQGKRNGQTSKTALSAVLETKPFAVDTAEKTGQSVRTIREKIQVVDKLTPETKEIVKMGAIGMKSALKNLSFNSRPAKKRGQ